MSGLAPKNNPQDYDPLVGKNRVPLIKVFVSFPQKLINFPLFYFSSFKYPC